MSLNISKKKIEPITSNSFEAEVQILKERLSAIKHNLTNEIADSFDNLFDSIYVTFAKVNKLDIRNTVKSSGYPSTAISTSFYFENKTLHYTNITKLDKILLYTNEKDIGISRAFEHVLINRAATILQFTNTAINISSYVLDAADKSANSKLEALLNKHIDKSRVNAMCGLVRDVIVNTSAVVYCASIDISMLSKEMQDLLKIYDEYNTKVSKFIIENAPIIERELAKNKELISLKVSLNTLKSALETKTDEYFSLLNKKVSNRRGNRVNGKLCLEIDKEFTHKYSTSNRYFNAFHKDKLSKYASSDFISMGYVFMKEPEYDPTEQKSALKLSKKDYESILRSSTEIGFVSSIESLMLSQFDDGFMERLKNKLIKNLNRPHRPFTAERMSVDEFYTSIVDDDFPPRTRPFTINPVPAPPERPSWLVSGTSTGVGTYELPISTPRPDTVESNPNRPTILETADGTPNSTNLLNSYVNSFVQAENEIVRSQIEEHRRMLEAEQARIRAQANIAINGYGTYFFGENPSG